MSQGGRTNAGLPNGNVKWTPSRINCCIVHGHNLAGSTPQAVKAQFALVLISGQRWRCPSSGSRIRFREGDAIASSAGKGVKNVVVSQHQGHEI